jgi:hypothetical protein
MYAIAIAAAAVVTGFVVALGPLRPSAGDPGALASLSVPTYPNEGRLSPQAAFWGQLVVDDGCLELHWNGAERFLVWPANLTNVQGDVITIDGAELSVGDHVIISGGDSVAAPLTETDRWVTPPLARCWQEHAIRVGGARTSTEAELHELDESP